MATFIMVGKYSLSALQEISKERTKKADEIIKNLGGKVKSTYVLLGEHDLHIIADLPDMKQAIKASIALTKLTAISFTTSEAITAEEFDTMME
ncbi:GYD domain-containing protein [Bacteroidota bacterium]